MYRSTRISLCAWDYKNCERLNGWPGGLEPRRKPRRTCPPGADCGPTDLPASRSMAASHVAELAQLDAAPTSPIRDTTGLRETADRVTGPFGSATGATRPDAHPGDPSLSPGFIVYSGPYSFSRGVSADNGNPRLGRSSAHFQWYPHLLQLNSTQ
jgi:hypothetical protein